MYEILGDKLKLLGHSDDGNDLLPKYRRDQCAEELKMYIIRHRTINRYIVQLFSN